MHAAERAYCSWRLVPAPKRAEMLFAAGADHRGAQRGLRARHDARDGQGARGDTRRRAGSDRHDLLHGGRGPPPVRSDRAVRAARQVRDVGATAARRVLDHHAVEFPDGDSVVEDRAGARVRQHRRVQAGHADAAVGGQLRQGAGGSRHPARRRQPGHRRPRCRRADDDARRGEGRVVYRIDGSRSAGESARGLELQEDPSRDGRQERRHDHGRRTARARGGGLPVGRVRHDGTTVHGGEPRGRPRDRSTTSSCVSSSRARARCESATDWTIGRRWGRRSASRSSKP